MFIHTVIFILIFIIIYNIKYTNIHKHKSQYLNKFFKTIILIIIIRGRLTFLKTNNIPIIYFLSLNKSGLIISAV